MNAAVAAKPRRENRYQQWPYDFTTRDYLMAESVVLISSLRSFPTLERMCIRGPSFLPDLGGVYKVE